MNAQPHRGNPPDAYSARRITAFQGSRRIAGGELAEVLPAIEAARRQDSQAPLLVFDDATSQVVELDLRDPADKPPDAAERLERQQEDPMASRKR